jgi:hypothetical protein
MCVCRWEGKGDVGCCVSSTWKFVVWGGVGCWSCGGDFVWGYIGMISV